jgi:hypothetical protein
VVATDQGVVIDQNVRLSEPLNGSNLGLERPIGKRRFQWVTTEDKEHGDARQV